MAALMTSRTVGEAATVAGVSERTARRWCRLPAVRRALSEAQDETLKRATAYAVAAVSEAIAVLEKIMTDADVSAAARVSAARCILDAAARLTETAHLVERVAALEERLL